MSTSCESPVARAARLFSEAAGAAKCAPCGCAHSAVAAVETAPAVTDAARSAAAELAARFEPERYDCLGCPVCWPAEALGILADAGLVEAAGACPTDPVDVRAGWPPLLGAYRVLRWSAPVAICTLGDAGLADAVTDGAGGETGIVGTLVTENLGIERLVANVITNPNLRFLLVAGTEPHQPVGHLPGASLLALSAHGIDPSARIIGAPGRRPVLRNARPEDIAHFRSVVEAIDLIGESDPAVIAEAASRCGERNPGPAGQSGAIAQITTTPGRLPPRMTADPSGYFLVLPDPARGLLVLEHYSNDGLLDAVIEGPTPAHCYTTAIESGLVSRLDHAAYLGRELTRAETALAEHARFVQDAAPEDSGCHGACGGRSC